MKKKYNSLYQLHFGKIMFNYSVVGLVLMTLIWLGSMLSALYFVLAVFIAFFSIICTCGLVFLTSPGFISGLFNNGEKLITVITKMYIAFPYIFGITIGASVLSIIFLSIQKEKRSVVKIVVSSIILGLSLIVGLVFLLSGGVN